MNINLEPRPYAERFKCGGSLIDLCEQHNLTVISVGMNLKQIDAYRDERT